jgi:hypothetical protein
MKDRPKRNKRNPKYRHLSHLNKRRTKKMQTKGKAKPDEHADQDDKAPEK